MSTSPGADSVMTCMACGANIYQEHIDRGLAGMWGGKVLCPVCLGERKKAGGAGEGDLASLAMADQPDSTEASSRSSVHGFGLADTDPETQGYQRPLNPTGQGATRIRTFHAKLSAGAVHHLNQQVNSWLDSHPDIEIKFANSTVGVWEGKTSEVHLVLTLFY